MCVTITVREQEQAAVPTALETRLLHALWGERRFTLALCSPLPLGVANTFGGSAFGSLHTTKQPEAAV